MTQPVQSEIVERARQPAHSTARDPLRLKPGSVPAGGAWSELPRRLKRNNFFLYRIKCTGFELSVRIYKHTGGSEIHLQENGTWSFQDKDGSQPGQRGQDITTLLAFLPSV